MKPPFIKYLRYFLVTVLLLFFFNPAVVFSQKKYAVQYIFQDKDTPEHFHRPGLKTEFESRSLAETYINDLPQMLLKNGFAAASVDTVFYDSSFAHVDIFLGKEYKWSKIATDSLEKVMLENIGWNEGQFENKDLDYSKLSDEEQKILRYYENNGYPFAEVSLQNVSVENEKIKGELSVKKGPLYHIDSIHVYGKVKIKSLFLQHYLGIFNGSVYNNEQLQKISSKLDQLPFLQQQQGWNLTMLGTGATINLYLGPKRSSEINVLVGFVPANTITGKAQITADVHLNLKNSFGSGENILVNWQQLQPQSPRLNLGYSVPYIFNSNFGFHFSFDLLKRDSSYLQLDGILGLQYFISTNKNFDFFYQTEQNFLLPGGVDTTAVLYSKKLPGNIDVRSGNFGIGYHFIKTNYNLNPRKGNELSIIATGGIKKTSKNNDVVNLKDPSEPNFDFNSLYDSIKLKTWRFKLLASGAHYFPLGERATFKTAANIGWLESPQNFQNELFRIGGYALLRGFDEESIFASKYGVFTGEYRYLTGANSYFFGFSDVGFTKTKSNVSDYSNSFISGGIGLELETKFGLLNLSYAIGKRNRVKFDLRNSSKIHFGYINYF